VQAPKDILKQSIVKVITPEIYDKYGFPVEGGLMDIRMGVIEPGLRCKTCGNNYKDCEGHFGHLELARPILNVLYIDQITKSLQGTCSECYRVMIPEDKIKLALEDLDNARKTLPNDKYIKYFAKFFSQRLSKVKVCPHCEAKKEPVRLDKSSVFVFTEGDKKRLLTTEIRFRFENIPEEDLPLLNLINMRPEWALLTVLPIPPVSMRSTITLQLAYLPYQYQH